MKRNTLYQQKLHVMRDKQEQIRELISLEMKSAALKLIQGIFSEEVKALCGRSFSRKLGGALCHRGGSDPGSVKLNGQRLKVKKPRVKRKGKDVQLDSYQAFQEFDLLNKRVMDHMLRGVSTRDYEPLLNSLQGGLGLKKSTVSKAFMRGSKQALEDINGKDLSKQNWFCVMIDGIEFKQKHVIVAMGIDVNGRKHILGLREGSSEHHELCKDLLQSLIDRNLPQEADILFVLDGSKALRKAVNLVFGEVHVQRCIRHKERNILAYLPDIHHGELRRKWKMIHGLESFKQAEHEMKKLRMWLSSINQQAVNSLDEANNETLTVIKLQAPALLRKTLLSTNPIESMFDKVRYMTNRVKNWKSNTNMPSRWAAASLQLSQKKFRRIKGYKEIKAFTYNMKNLNQNLQHSKKAA